MIDFKPNIHKYIEAEIEVLRKLDLDELNAAVNAILEARNRGGTIYTMGNGGSAATASHMVCDLAKGTSELIGGLRFHVVCLSDNIPMVTAVANDFCYEDAFVYQLQGQLKPEDLVIAISGSGSSENVVRAAKYAKELGVPVIGITGYSGGKLYALADYRMHVRIDDMQIAEDIHMMFDHMTMRVIGENEREAGKTKNM